MADVAKLRGTTRVVDIDALRPNPWNPNVQSEFMFERERRSIRRFGFLDPVTVRQVPDLQRQTYEIIDGEHRWRAAKLEGLTEISINDIGEVDDAEAKALTDLLNALHGEPDRKKQAELVTQVIAFAPDLADILPYTTDQYAAFKAELDYDWSGLDTQGTTHEKTTTQFMFIVANKAAQKVTDALERAKAGDSKTKDADAFLAIVEHFLATTPNARSAAPKRRRSPPPKRPKADAAT